MSNIEKVVDAFVVDEWSAIARLYDAVVQFAGVYKGRTFAINYYYLSLLLLITHTDQQSIVTKPL